MVRAKRGSSLTASERSTIEKSLTDGLSIPEIGLLLGRSVFTIRNELKRHGGRSVYCATKAQEYHETANERRKESLRKWAEENPPPTLSRRKKKLLMKNLEQRIDMLEQKVDKLILLLKGKDGKDKKL